ncbi:MAG: aspartate carbamoyltransferase catalytic subunit, partial [Epsilonproteobacteria bacterium]|nr:aspartate carbamoyltransferase catalytic subunit [Campylobacterota bacterium]
MQHLITTKDLTTSQIERLFKEAKEFKEKKAPKLLEDKLIMTLFFEPSTRTRSSFEVAAKRLGASVVHFDPSKSSTKKGESLTDTFLNLCAMGPDAIIVRHSQNNTPLELAKLNLSPVINAGAGNFAHPTQALLDLFTIYEKFNGDIKGKKIAIIGDIINSRVAASNIELLQRMGLKVYLVAPKPFMPDINLPKFENIEDIIDEVDIIMSLRAQLERHKKPIFEDYNEYAKHYCITKELIKDRDIMIMHPGPVMRNIDIS